MSSNPTPNPFRSTQTEIELALTQSLLGNEPTYPWLPAEAEAYFEQVAAAGTTLDISEAEATQGWQALSNQLHQLWGTSAVSVQDALWQKFAGRLSSSLIDQIAQTAQQVMDSGRPLAEQLIACVHDTFSSWDETDLQVMARPLAYAMRGQEEIVDVTIASVRNVNWEDLSEMEQARISLAAARYALDYLKENA